MVQQTLSGGEADMVSLELRGLVQVVQLQAGSRHRGLEHFCLPVVDGDLQVADVGSHDLGRGCCKQVAGSFIDPVENRVPSSGTSDWSTVVLSRLVWCHLRLGLCCHTVANWVLLTVAISPLLLLCRRRWKRNRSEQLNSPAGHQQ